MLDVTRAYGLDLLFPARDTSVGWSLKVFGEFARVEQDLIADYLAALPPGLVLDVGANIGAVCLPLARRFPDRRFVAVEAHRGLAGVLAANALNNRLMNLEVIHAAAGASRGLLRFPARSLGLEGNFGIFSVDGDGPKEDVRSLPLDAFGSVALVKIDVEGHEEQVLAGASRLLRDARPVILMEVGTRDAERRAALFRPLLEHGYRLHWFWSPFVTLKPLKPGPLVPRIQGDLCALALPEDAPLLWDVPPVCEKAPRLSDFPYLERYGIRTEAPHPAQA